MRGNKMKLKKRWEEENGAPRRESDGRREQTSFPSSPQSRGLECGGRRGLQFTKLKGNENNATMFVCGTNVAILNAFACPEKRRFPPKHVSLFTDFSGAGWGGIKGKAPPPTVLLRFCLVFIMSSKSHHFLWRGAVLFFWGRFSVTARESERELVTW